MLGDRIRTRRILPLCVIILAALTCTSQGKIIYVDDDANGLANGTSWRDAYKFLQDALAVAKAGDQVRVAQGVYRPDQGTGMKPGDYEATFRLVSGAALKGGYAGLANADPNAWDPASYETILNGDLKGNDDFTWRATLEDNSSHIVTAIRVDATTVLEALTITHGVYHMVYDRGGKPHPPQDGGNLYNESGSPLIRRCVFSSGYGSGVFNYAGSAAHFEGCTFEGDYQGTAVVDYQSQSTFHECRFIRNHWVGIGLTESTSEVSDCLFCENEGTGIVLGAKSRLTVLNSRFIANKVAVWDNGGGQVECEGCVFENNWSEAPGGAAHVDHGEFTDCIFRGNSARQAGAIEAGSLELTRCVLVQNWAEIAGAISCREADFRQCVFAGNRAETVGVLDVATGGTIYNCTFVGNRANSWGIIMALSATKPVVLMNCIFRDNAVFDTRPLIMGNWKTAIRYCNVSDSSPDLWRFVGEAVGDIDVDPLFTDAGHWDPNGTPDDPNDDFWVEGDYHLKSQAGRWDPNDQSWIINDVTSPCIDAGDPNSPVGDEPMPNGGRINMGAYGGTAEASKSPFDEACHRAARFGGVVVETQYFASQEPFVAAGR
jgi:hypothetical protein